MTKEQEEAIEILSDSNILFNIQRDTALSIRVAIETVLNILKQNSAEIQQKNTELAEKNAEIEKYKDLYNKALADLVKAEKMNMQRDEQIAKYEKIYKEYDCYRWVKELEKKDKIIDLMAERIEWLCKSNGILLDKEHDENFTQEDIKQYFRQKATKNG